MISNFVDINQRLQVSGRIGYIAEAGQFSRSMAMCTFTSLSLTENDPVSPTFLLALAFARLDCPFNVV